MTITEAKDLKTRIIEGLFKQGIVVAVLVLLLLWIVSVVRDVLINEIPKHLAIIQRGYQKISDENNKVIERMNTDNNSANRARDVRYAEIIKLLSDRFDVSVEKLENKIDRILIYQKEK